MSDIFLKSIVEIAITSIGVAAGGTRDLKRLNKPIRKSCLCSAFCSGASRAEKKMKTIVQNLDPPLHYTITTASSDRLHHWLVQEILPAHSCNQLQRCTDDSQNFVTTTQGHAVRGEETAPNLSSYSPTIMRCVAKNKNIYMYANLFHKCKKHV